MENYVQNFKITFLTCFSSSLSLFAQISRKFKFAFAQCNYVQNIAK